MSNPLQLYINKYIKRPDCWKSLLILSGFLGITKIYVDRKVQNFIFGEDGKGGEMLIVYTRINEHDSEFREERKKFYWHQRLRNYYIPSGYNFNSQLDYKTLSYNYSHNDTWSDPRKIPHGHDPDSYTLHHVPHEYFHKD